MSLTGNIDSQRHQDKFNAPLKQKQERTAAEQEQSRQTSANGLQWASAQAVAAQQSTAQQAAGGNKISQTAIGTQQKSTAKQIELQAPGMEDVAMLSTTTAIKDESVYAIQQKGISAFLRRGFNMAALEEAYRETFRKSKSHNLLLERFMANVKFSAIKGLFSLLGMSAAEQDRIQKEVRKKTLAEIDSRLKNEWAYSSAMLEIVG